MDIEAVIEFLGNVPLLQQLPASSLKLIARVVVYKTYEKGEYVVREGQAVDGVHFVWEGEAEVTGHIDEESRPEFQLKKYDYFGHVVATAKQPADVVALTKLSCLELPMEKCSLLAPNSIWHPDKTAETAALIERILHLEPIEVNIFKGITLPDAMRFGKVFGGQMVGQALAAASKTVDSLKIVHSLHAYFLLVGDFNVPIIYNVHRVRDGNSFATRRVEAIQKGNLIFTLLASFNKEQEGFQHQIPTIPHDTPDPETLLNLEELRERRLTDPCLPRTYRHKVATAEYIPWPIEIRFLSPGNATNQTKSPPSQIFWFRAKGKLSDDQALHRCVLAYASDLLFSSVALNPHRRTGLRAAALSLDHAIWFNRHVKADDWLLFVIKTPTAYCSRGCVTGEMFNRKGELVASIFQEALLRQIKTNKSSKL